MVLRAFSAGESVCAKVLISRKPRGIRGAFFVLSIFVLSVKAPAIAAGAFVVSGLRGFPRGFLCFQPLGYNEGHRWSGGTWRFWTPGSSPQGTALELP